MQTVLLVAECSNIVYVVAAIRSLGLFYSFRWKLSSGETASCAASEENIVRIVILCLSLLFATACLGCQGGSAAASNQGARANFNLGTF